MAVTKGFFRYLISYSGAGRHNVLEVLPGCNTRSDIGLMGIPAIRPITTTRHLHILSRTHLF